jgi:hypothetical protein
MITRQNYEIWFMDYADGNLTPEDKAKVEAFLLVHQDLATEFEALELIVAPVADVQFDHKSALKRTENEVAIHAENVEVFVVLELDKELNHQAQQALNDYFVAHPQYAHLRDEYAHTLLPVPQLVYENKAGLKKKRGIVRPLWYAIPVAAAASVALFFCIDGPPIRRFDRVP